MQGLRDTENERARKLLKTKDENRGDFLRKNEQRARYVGPEFK